MSSLFPVGLLRGDPESLTFPLFFRFPFVFTSTIIYQKLLGAETTAERIVLQ